MLPDPTSSPRLSFRLQVSVHAEPLDVGVEPAGAGGFLGVHAEAVAALFVVVELDGALGLSPVFDQTEVRGAQERVVGGARREQGRRVGGAPPRREAAV